MSTAREKAESFLAHEHAFRLGKLPTECSNPKTARFSQTVAGDIAAGLRMLASVDADILPVAQRVFGGPEFARLVDALVAAGGGGRRICFSGCGATGRLSILLEAAWRRFWQELRVAHPALSARLPDFEPCAVSIMTGGDHALIRSVEGFEDYASFGRHQVVEIGLMAGDVLVATTEGGETSSVIGSAWEALERGAQVFFAFNNPTAVLVEHVERSRQVIQEPRITKLDLATGPMAIAGSTRMQATTIELLVLGGALEMAIVRLLQEHLSAAELTTLGIEPHAASDYARLFADLLAQLAQPAVVADMARLVEFEEQIYRRQGLITYLTDRFLLDVLTDTTERAPTFRLPPFRKCDDQVSALSWAFVKNPLYDTDRAWQEVLRREGRGLTWDAETYRQLGASAAVQANPPQLNNRELAKFSIGREADPARSQHPHAAVLAILVGDEAARAADDTDPLHAGIAQIAAAYPRVAAVAIGLVPPPAWATEHYHVACHWPASPVDLWARLAVKLVLNTLSTATMARLGRVSGNWMICVETSNKKLIDRGTRLISELAGLSYDDACRLLHETMEEVGPRQRATNDAPSPVALAIERALAARGTQHA
jgi:N-acetylmuramic acid 6-phosphate etherase